MQQERWFGSSSDLYMAYTYKIICTPPDLMNNPDFRRLPSPIKRPALKEIYNFRVEKDCIYLFDRGIDEKTTGQALKIFLDIAFSNNTSVTVERTPANS
jgi:hypothetical protein